MWVRSKILLALCAETDVLRCPTAENIFFYKPGQTTYSMTTPAAPAPASGGAAQQRLPMYVHDTTTSALFNDLGIYVLTRLDRMQGMRSFKQIPALYNMQAQADAAEPAAEWTCKDFWPEVRNSKDQDSSSSSSAGAPAHHQDAPVVPGGARDHGVPLQVC